MSRKLTYDTWLFAAAMLILVVGLVMIYSASAMIATQRFGHGPYYFLMRQLAFLVVGGAAMLFLMHLESGACCRTSAWCTARWRSWRSG